MKKINLPILKCPRHTILKHPKLIIFYGHGVLLVKIMVCRGCVLARENTIAFGSGRTDQGA